MQQESADVLSADVDMNYGNPTITPLPVFPSVNPPCLYQAGPEPGISSKVNSQIYPRKEPKGQEGSAEAQPVDHDTNYGRPYHHTLARVSCHLLLSIQHVQHQPGSTPGLLSIVVDRDTIFTLFRLQ